MDKQRRQPYEWEKARRRRDIAELAYGLGLLFGGAWMLDWLRLDGDTVTILFVLAGTHLAAFSHGLQRGRADAIAERPSR